MEAFTKGELSRAFAWGTSPAKSGKTWSCGSKTSSGRIKNEMKGPDTSIEDDDMRLLYGEERPELDDAKARRLRSARDVKKMLASLSVDSRGLKSGTEIHAVARTEDSDGDDDEGGLFAGVSSYLSG